MPYRGARVHAVQPCRGVMYSSCWSHANVNVRTFIKAIAALAIDLICGDIDEALDAPIHAAGLQQHMCAIRIVHSEGQAVAKTVVHMGLHHAQWVRVRIIMKVRVRAIRSRLLKRPCTMWKERLMTYGPMWRRLCNILPLSGGMWEASAHLSSKVKDSVDLLGA